MLLDGFEKIAGAGGFVAAPGIRSPHPVQCGRNCLLIESNDYPEKPFHTPSQRWCREQSRPAGQLCPFSFKRGKFRPGGAMARDGDNQTRPCDQRGCGTGYRTQAAADFVPNNSIPYPLCHGKSKACAGLIRQWQNGKNKKAPRPRGAFRTDHGELAGAADSQVAGQSHEKTGGTRGIRATQWSGHAPD